MILTCTTPDNKPIIWRRQDGTELAPPAFVISGDLTRSTLTIVDVREDNEDTYICRVGQMTGEYELIVLDPTSTY